MVCIIRQQRGRKAASEMSKNMYAVVKMKCPKLAVETSAFRANAHPERSVMNISLVGMRQQQSLVAACSRMISLLKFDFHAWEIVAHADSFTPLTISDTVRVYFYYCSSLDPNAPLLFPVCLFSGLLSFRLFSSSPCVSPSNESLSL